RTWKTWTGMARLEALWLRRKHFHDDALARIAAHISQSETQHTGELMVAIETITPPHEPDSRTRALEVFGRLRTWDTPLNTGVLLYLSLDKGRIEIIADRGIRATPDQWQQVCLTLQQRLARGDYMPGLLHAIDLIEQILREGCPSQAEAGESANLLPDDPVML
ncbi:MAG TPA: TPM domain-containing protein, partial [Burkholderiaceae bacterium]|nr:TPM domain-containing protein [Burkholderiaceae bacterium]